VEALGESGMKVIEVIPKSEICGIPALSNKMFSWWMTVS